MGKAAGHLSISERENIALGLFIVESTNNVELIGLYPDHDDKIHSFSYNPSKDFCYYFTPSCRFRRMLNFTVSDFIKNSSIHDLIASVGGKSGKSAELHTAFGNMLDEQLSKYATIKTFQVPFLNDENEPEEI